MVEAYDTSDVAKATEYITENIVSLRSESMLGSIDPRLQANHLYSVKNERTGSAARCISFMCIECDMLCLFSRVCWKAVTSENITRLSLSLYKRVPGFASQ